LEKLPKRLLGELPEKLLKELLREFLKDLLKHFLTRPFEELLKELQELYRRLCKWG
jgi:hypothetical protein